MLGNGKTMRLFITGGTGFFGKSMLDFRIRHPEWSWAKADWVILSRFPDRFAARYPYLAHQPGVTFIEGDVRDFIFPVGHFDAIIHAATSATTTMSDDEMTSVILDGTNRVVEFARSSECRSILFTSSGAVYGPRISPSSETDECNPVTAYGRGKLAAERLLAGCGIDVKIARCFAFVGAYLDKNIQYAIGNFIRNCLDSEDIVIKGDGTPLRSYLYADDLVEWLFAILEHGENGRPYNVGSDYALSISELAQRVRDVLGAKNEITVKEKSEPGVKPSVYVPDISRVKNELGLRANVGLADAIRLSSMPIS